MNEHVFGSALGCYVIRAARPEDEEPLRRMLEQTAPDDIRLRFFRYMRSFPHALVEPLIRSDDRRSFALVSEPAAARGSIAGTAMLVAEAGGAAAEFGIIVARAHAGARLGSHLMDCVFDVARAHGIGRVYGTILRDNANMIDLVRRLGFTVTDDPDDPGCVRAERSLGAADLGQCAAPGGAQAGGMHGS